MTGIVGHASSLKLAIAVIGAIGAVSQASATMLYGASLRDGNYGNGFVVDTFSFCSDPDGSSCGDGNLSNIGISNTPSGVNFTSNNAVINYSIGRDYGSAMQNAFRSQGTISVSFNASGTAHVNGQPFTDNYGFNQFNSGQGTFGVGLARNAGADAVLHTSDDLLGMSWSTWHDNVWYSHISTPVLLAYDRWYDIGFAWGGPGSDFELWVDGELRASHNLPAGVTSSWGSPWTGLGSAYNLALGEIHERAVGNSSTYGITFADLEIWNEYRPEGATLAPVPLPPAAWLFASAFIPLLRQRRKLKAPAPPC